MKNQIPFNVLPTKKVKKALFTTLATVTVLSQMLTVYPTTSAAAETGSQVGTTEAPTRVGDFATLKQVIEADNGITNIELTADITMTAEININKNKTELTIDGKGHTLTESKVNIGSSTGTIYAYNSVMKTMNIKNMTILGSHYYSPFTVHDGLQGVTQNFENIDYSGPQFVYNLHGYVNFSGTNKIVTSKPIDNLGTLNEMVETTGVTIAGNFTAEHNTTGSTAFSLFSAVGTVGDPYFIIKDGAKVNIDSKGPSVIWATADQADFKLGKNAEFNVTSADELFQTAMKNVTFDNGSTTVINRIGVSSDALMPVSRTFTVNPNASLKAVQPAAATAHIIRTTVANAVININDPRMLDLNANGTGANRVFSAGVKPVTINFNNLAEIGVFNATNKTETPNLAWQNATFSVLQSAAGQAGTVQAGAISASNDIQSTFVLADAKRITTTGTVAVAQKAVNELFNSNDPATDAIKDTTTQGTIDAAQKLVDAVTDPEAKAVLQKDLDRAQELLDERNAVNADKERQAAALKAVNELFNSDKPSTDVIKDTTDQAAIDAAQKLVNAVTDPTVKAQLQKDLDRAQELLDERNATNAAEKARQEAALKAVNELFNSDKPSTDAIKDITNQDAIDAAQKLVDAVTDGAVKAQLQKDLDRAQELLDARNAELAAEKARQEAALKAVNELFNSDKPATDAIKDITNQDAIDAAQKLVDAVKDPVVKAQLQKDLDRAQELLDERNEASLSEKERQEAAQKAVNELFNDNKPATDAIKDTTDQATIDAAQKLVDAVKDETVKAQLQKDLDRAQELLDERNAANAAEKARQEAAQKAVNELFNSDKPSTDAIKASTNQDAIDAAQKLVDEVKDPTVKAQLQKDLDRAQELLDARNAELAAEKARQEAAQKAVNELFNDNKPSTDVVKDTTTQASIDTAQKLVDEVKDPTVKAQLQKDLDRAQELLNERMSTVGTITPAD
ncbi:toxin Cry1Ac domain D-VI-related protein, partial [Listeria newyorkensis]